MSQGDLPTNESIAELAKKIHECCVDKQVVFKPLPRTTRTQKLQEADANNNISFTSNGNTYRGRMLSGTRASGVGELECIAGNDKGASYVGSIKSISISGNGTLVSPQTGKVYDGGFAKGKLQGKAIVFDKSSETRFEGEFVEGKRHGQGITFQPDGASLVATFEGDEQMGEAVLVPPPPCSDHDDNSNTQSRQANEAQQIELLQQQLDQRQLKQQQQQQQLSPVEQPPVEQPPVQQPQVQQPPVQQPPVHDQQLQPTNDPQVNQLADQIISLAVFKETMSSWSGYKKFIAFFNTCPEDKRPQLVGMVNSQLSKVKTLSLNSKFLFFFVS